MQHSTTPKTENEFWWTAFESALDKAGVKTSTSIFPAATDSRFLRVLNIPCFGFSVRRSHHANAVKRYMIHYWSGAAY